MQASIGHHGDVTVVHLIGRLDVESAAQFRQACLVQNTQLARRRVVFDFRQMTFVGSTGLLTFLETLQKFSNANPHACKFSSVSSEFQKLFAATPLTSIEIFETPEHAVRAYVQPGSQLGRVAVQAVPLTGDVQKESLETDAVVTAADGTVVSQTQPVERESFGFLTYHPEPTSAEDDDVSGLTQV